MVGTGKPAGKTQFTDPYTANHPSKVDMYSLMTFKPLTPDESMKTKSTWNDAPLQPRKKAAAATAGAAGASGAQQQQAGSGVRQLLVSAGAEVPMRFVPYGGLAQERGMTLDAIVANRKQFGVKR